MGKEKTVVERMISLINRYYRQMEKSMDESSNFNRDLEVINSAFTVLDPDDFSFLSKVDHEQLNALLNLVLREDEKELANGIRAAHYLAQNDIELVDEQMDKLRDLISRSEVKKRSLQRSIATREKAIATLEDCSNLEDELKGLSTSGVFDEKTIAQFFKLFNIKPDEQGRYLDAILKFNTTRILTSIRKMSKEEDKEIEELDVPIEVIDIENKKITEEQLKLVFEKHDFDFSILKPKTLKLLLEQGDLAKIDDMLECINDERLDFVRKNGKILAKFLLESTRELILEGCQVFDDAHVGREYLRSYKSVFFLSEEEAKGIQVTTPQKYGRRMITPPIDIYAPESDKKDEPLEEVVGKHKDFFENLKLLESLGYDRQTLLTRQVKILTSSHRLLVQRLEELNLYEFPVGEENFPLSTLSSTKIMDLADGFIELGEKNYILNCSSRLTAYIDGTLERLYALQKEKKDYCSWYGGKKVMRGFVTDPKLPCGLSSSQIEKIVPKDVQELLEGNQYAELLDNYLPLTISSETLEDPIISKLEEENKVSPWEYNFNGVIISRKKLLRNYEFLMTSDFVPHEEKEADKEHILLVSAIHNSMLNATEIEKVSAILSTSVKMGGNHNAILKK